MRREKVGSYSRGLGLTHRQTDTHRQTYSHTQHTHTHTDTDTHSHTDTHTDILTLRYTHRHTHTDTHSHSDTHTYTHTHTQIHTETQTHRDRHTHTHTHTHIHNTHSHTDSHSDTHTAHRHTHSHSDTHRDTDTHTRSSSLPRSWKEKGAGGRLPSTPLSKLTGSPLWQDFDRAYATVWRRQWHPTPVLLPGKSHGRRSLVGYSPWGHKESDTTEQLHFTSLHAEVTVQQEENGRLEQTVFSFPENP